jgi:hypothetical protein
VASIHSSLEFDAPVDPSQFERLAGVSGLMADGNRVSFKVEGNLDALVKAAGRHGVELLDSEPRHHALGAALAPGPGGRLIRGNRARLRGCAGIRGQPGLRAA